MAHDEQQQHNDGFEAHKTFWYISQFAKTRKNLEHEIKLPNAKLINFRQHKTIELILTFTLSAVRKWPLFWLGSI